VKNELRQRRKASLSEGKVSFARGETGRSRGKTTLFSSEKNETPE
jgi:hypothetical protein